MEIIFNRFNRDLNLESIARLIEKTINFTRFTAEIERFHGKKLKIRIRNIRLRESKPYCGSHPSFCESPSNKPRKAKFLEGADWVAFNDLLNTFCDAFGLSASIKSSVCKIRYGKERRVEYSATYRKMIPQWEMDGEHEEITYSPDTWLKSEYPPGTPGEYKVFTDLESEKIWKEKVTNQRG